MKETFLDLMLPLGLGATDPRDRLKRWILKDYRVFFFGINISDTWLLWHLYRYLFLFFILTCCMLQVCLITLNIWKQTGDVNADCEAKVK